MIAWFKRRRRATHDVDLSAEPANEAAEHLLAMDEAIESLLDLAKMESWVARGALSTDFVAHWQRAVEAFDAYVAISLSAGAAGQPVSVSCGRGCAGCCQVPPRGVHGIEILHILLRAPEQASAVSNDTSGPCPFLEANHECGIYSVRPLACRMHFSRSEPALCWPTHPRRNEARSLDLPPPQAIEHALTALRDALGLTSVGDALVPALLAVRDQILAGRRLIEAPSPQRNRRRARSDR